MRIFYLFLALAVLGSGCSQIAAWQISTAATPSAPFFTFSLSFPPKAFFRPDTNTILIINRVDLKKKQLSARNLKSVQAGAFTAIEYAGDQLGGLPHVHIISLPDSSTFALNTDSIAGLAAKYHADYTLALTDYDADVSLDDFYEDGVHYNHTVSLKFIMYVGDGKLYKELSGSAAVGSVQTNYGLVASLVVHPTVGGNKDKVIDATRDAVFTALLDYLPYTETESRPLYNDPKLGPVADEIIARHFDKAYTLSEPFFQDRDSVLACKAAYNMAVVYEAQGDFDEALNMAQLSAGKFKNKYADDLLAYLKSK